MDCVGSLIVGGDGSVQRIFEKNKEASVVDLNYWLALAIEYELERGIEERKFCVESRERRHCNQVVQYLVFLSKEEEL